MSSLSGLLWWIDAADARALLLGRDRRLASRWVAVAGALLFGSVAFFPAVRALGYPCVHLLFW